MDSLKHTRLPANSQLCNFTHQQPTLCQRRCLLYASGDASGSLAASKGLSVATVVGITVVGITVGVVAAVAVILDVVVHQVIKCRQTAALN